MSRTKSALFQELLSTIESSENLIVHLAAENAPYSKRGGLGDVVGSLPVYFAQHHYTNIVFSPYYKLLNGDPELIYDDKIEFNGVSYCYQLFSIKVKSHFNIFVKIEEAFSFDNIYPDGLLPYNTGVTLNYFIFTKIVVHFISIYLKNCSIFTHDWHVGATHPYIKIFQLNLPTFHVIHNYHYQGDLFSDILPYLEPDLHPYLNDIFETYGHCSLSALAIENTDQIITVSPTYSSELQTQRAPHPGLQVISDKINVTGILNGIYSTEWSPMSDNYIIENYSKDSIDKKVKNKEYLLRKLKLNVDISTPVISMLSRLTIQKGIDLFIDLKIGSQFSPQKRLRKLLDLGMILIICGTPQGGLDGPIDIQFKQLYNEYKENFVYINEYTEEIAHQILAGSDLLLHPSRFEPCGLTQMYALAYGTIPIVNPVGGLKDTVTCILKNPENGFGFHMSSYGFDELYNVTKQAISHYKRQDDWRGLILRSMEQNNDWIYRIQPYLNLLKNGSDQL